MFMCPFYGVDEDREPYVIGTAVPVEIAGERFLLSAAHVLDENEDTSLLVWSGGDQVPLLAPDTCKAVVPASGNREDDKIDIACMRLEPPFYDRLDRVAFMTVDLVDVSGFRDPQSLFTFVGFSSSANRPKHGAHSLSLTAMTYTNRRASDDAYEKLGLLPEAHVVVPFNKKRVKDEEGRVVTAPDPRGMSGGPVWRHSPNACPKLVAIGTEHNGPDKLMVGVGIAFFVEAMRMRWPRLSAALPEVKAMKVNVRTQ